MVHHVVYVELLFIKPTLHGAAEKCEHKVRPHDHPRIKKQVFAAERARQLIDGVPPLIDAKDKENMPLSVAIDEVNRGLITYERSPEIDVK